jgi:hypothetical protein
MSNKFADFVDDLALDLELWEPEFRKGEVLERSSVKKKKHRGRPEHVSPKGGGQPVSYDSPSKRLTILVPEDDLEKDKREAKKLGITTSELYRGMREFYYDYFRQALLKEYFPKRTPPPITRRKKRKPQSDD